MRDIIVIGASAGGVKALTTLVSGLPPDLPASIFIVWHMSPYNNSVLPSILNKANSIYATDAVDGAAIELNRIYVAPPDRHLLVEQGHMRVTKGPKENRFRPAVDPLFRSAAYRYGSRVIGVVLSGALDDGTAGLWTVKYFGGTAIVQDPADAVVSSMPDNARKAVQVDHAVPVSQMADLLTHLVQEAAEEKTAQVAMDHRKKTEIEIRIAAEENAFKLGSTQLGQLTPFTCPDCHGVMFKLQDDDILRFRCHTGHAFSAETLLEALSENIEESLWSALREVQESMMLLRKLEKRLAEKKEDALAALYREKVQEAEQRMQLLRQVVRQQEELSGES